MSAFTENEIKEQRLGRLATVEAEGRPHVVPFGFRYDAEHDTVDIGGHNREGRTGKAAFVVDDVLPPWRGVEIRGLAEVFSEGGTEVMEGFSEEVIRTFPRRIVGWDLDSGAFKANSRSVG